MTNLIIRIATILVLVIPFGLNVAVSQKINDFTIKKMPKKYSSVSSVAESVDLSTFFNLTQVLPAGYVTDGTVDYTKQLQEAIKKCLDVILPDFPVLVNDEGLSLQEGTRMYFSENSRLILQGSTKGTYEVLRIHGVNNVDVYNPRIIGDRENHKGDAGEWGMGISIRGSNNINIYNPEVVNCWGDGIYLGHLKNVSNKNIKIINAVLDNNRRNGISITSGDKVSVIGARISNSNGKAPEAGLCIEPSNEQALINNITLKDVVTFNNRQVGTKIAGLELLVNENNTPNKSVNIHIINIVDDSSKEGMFIGRIIAPDKKPGIPLKGRIVIENPTWLNNAESKLVKRRHYGRGPEIVFVTSKSKIKSRINEIKKDREVIIK